MRNIGIFVGRIDSGAAELLEVNLAKSLNKLDYNVYLITMYSSQLLNDYEVEVELQKDIPNIIRLGYDIKNKPIRFLKKILLVRSLKLECIISHNRGTDLFSYIIAFGTNTKHIKAFHTYFEKSHINSLMNKFWAYIVSTAAHTYHISPYTLSENYKTFNLKREKTSIVQNVLDRRIINKKSTIDLKSLYNLPKASKIILTVGRLVPIKGIELNLKIVIPLLKEDKYLYYVIAGDKSLQDIGYYDNLLKIVYESKLEKQILFIGFQKDILGLMREANVLLHFAKREAFGLVLIEALYVCLPIVSSNVGGIPDVLKESSFKIFSINALVDARKEVVKYLDNKEKENCNFSSSFEKRTNKDRASEIALIIEKICGNNNG